MHDFQKKYFSLILYLKRTSKDLTFVFIILEGIKKGQ